MRHWYFLVYFQHMFKATVIMIIIMHGYLLIINLILKMETFENKLMYTYRLLLFVFQFEKLGLTQEGDYTKDTVKAGTEYVKEYVIEQEGNIHQQVNFHSRNVFVFL